VTPIQSLREGAARIGAGALDQRIEVRTGDELEALAEEFNRMTGRLSESYADLEQKVDFRTRALADALREIKEKSSELETVSRHKSEFLANMSHELRTPLNAVIGFSEVLLERMVGQLNEKQEEYLQDILDSGRHLLSLINDILDLSKIEAGRMDLDISHFWLPEAIDEAFTMVRADATRRGIGLTLRVGPDVGAIAADERKVKQVLFNLLSNAVKFTEDGGQVYVTASAAADEMVISVRDTGIGIADDEQERVFDEFYQSAETATGRAPGTGLGLPLAKRFVELHGGRLWLESKLGKGSNFTFTVPLDARTEPQQLAPVTADVAAGGALATVLVVEDDERALNLLRVHLEDAGYEVAAANDAEHGLELARTLRPYAIMLDIKLPGMDGWAFLARAKSDPATAGIPIIVVSMVDERARGLALGAFDYLVKPVGRESLLAVLRALPAA